MSLGKGLSALIRTDFSEERPVSAKKVSAPKPLKEKEPSHTKPVVKKSEGAYNEVSIDDIEPNAFQPRMVITDESLEGLVNSIKHHGFFSPILVKDKGNGKYSIIAGERRWRAAKIAGLQKLPIVVNKSNDTELMEMALVENIQRKDLNPIEEGLAFDHLRKEFGLTIKEIGDKMGLYPETVADKIKLLKLPVSVQELVLQEKLTQKHAEAIERLGNEAAMLAVSKMVLRDRLSADKTLELVQKLMEGMGLTQSSAPVEEFRQKYQYVVEGIKNKLGWKASLTKRQNGGATLTFSFNTENEIKDFFDKINTLDQPEDIDF